MLNLTTLSVVVIALLMQACSTALINDSNAQESYKALCENAKPKAGVWVPAANNFDPDNNGDCSF